LDQVAQDTNISIENLRLQTKDQISQKADSGMVDRLRDALTSKVDLDYL
jgi:hypothetical protein